MPNPPSFPIEPPILRQGNPNLYPQNQGGGFSWNVGYSPSPRQPETRRPSIEVPTWYPPSVAHDDGRLNAVELGDQGWRNAPHQAMDFPGTGEWWRQGEPTVETPTSTGGNIWGDTAAIQSGGGRSPSLLEDPNLDWTGTTQPEGEPVVEVPRYTNPLNLQGPPDEPLFADISNRSVLPSAPTSNEWTTSANDRRFLPGSGPDISSFGNNLTLGEFLNTPLATMHYGEGYSPVGGGDVSYADTTTHTAGDVPMAGVTPEAEQQGAIDTQNLRDQGLLPPSEENIPTGRAVSPEVRQAQGVPTGIGAILAAHPNLNNPASIRALNRGANPSDLIGHAQFDSHAANLMLMASQSYGGNPNYSRQDEIGYSDDFTHQTAEQVDAYNMSWESQLFHQQQNQTPEQAYQSMLNTQWQWANASNPRASHVAPAGWRPSHNTSFAQFMTRYHSPTTNPSAPAPPATTGGG